MYSEELNKNTELTQFLIAGNENMIDLLIKKGANVSVVDNHGRIAWQQYYQGDEN